MSVINKIDIAMEHVNGLCDGRLKWKMSIPVNFTEDSDTVIFGALYDAKKHIEADERRIAELAEALEIAMLSGDYLPAERAQLEQVLAGAKGKQ